MQRFPSWLRFVGVLVLGALLATLASWRLTGRSPISRDARTRDDGAPVELVLAHVTDPRAAVPAPRDGPPNTTVLVSALRALRAQPGLSTPELLVVSGDLVGAAAAESRSGVPDSTPARADSARSMPNGGTTTDSTVGRGGAAEPARRDAPAARPSGGERLAGGYAELGHVLAQSPAADVFLAAGSAIPAESLATLRAALDTTGVRVYDLAACFGPVGSSPELCDAGARHRLVALPALPNNVDSARAIIDAADSIVSRADADGRHVILVPASLPRADSASRRLAAAWVNLTSRDGVAAVLAPAGAGIATPTWKIVRTPSLGLAGPGPAATARGVSVVTLRGGVPQVEAMSVAQSFRRLPASLARPAALRGLGARFAELGESLGEPGRTAIFWIAVLTSFLTVAALWKVPDTVVETTTTVVPVGSAAPNAGAVAGAAAAGGATPAASTASSTSTTTVTDEGNVFQSNLGRTVISGLSGIAAVTILKDVWGITGSSGQALFAIVFIIAFFAFLILSALLRAFTEGSRDRMVATRHSVEIDRVPNPTWRRFTLWFGSYRTTALVFLDTFSSVLFGRAPAQLLVWTRRYTELQEALLGTVDRVREQVSDSVGDALRNAGVADARAERDYRVNVSLLATNGMETFYVSSARGSLARVFGEKSMAYVAIRSGEARWWKTSYDGGHKHVRSTGRLRAMEDAVPAAWMNLSTLTVLAGNAPPAPAPAPAQPAPAPAPAPASAPAPPPPDEVVLQGKRGDTSAVMLAATTVPTLRDLLKLLNGPAGFGGGSRPAVAWLDADGYLVLADSVAGDSALAVSTLTIGGVPLGPFVPAQTEGVTFFHNQTALFPGGATELVLREYFEKRGALDYEAFIVLPVPFAGRGLTSGARRAGIHISFSRAAYLNVLWPALDRVYIDAATPAIDRILPDYDAQRDMLQRPKLADRVLEGVLSSAVRVLGEVIQPLNDTWYWTRGRR